VYEEEDFEDDYLVGEEEEEEDEEEALEDVYEEQYEPEGQLDLFDEDEELEIPAPTHPAKKGSRSARGKPPIVHDDLLDEEEDDYDDEFAPPTPRRRTPTRPQSSSRKPPTRRPPSSSASRPSRQTSGRPPTRGSRRGAVVPYGSGPSQVGGAFTRGLSTLKNYIPDPTTVKDTALKAATAAGSVSTTFTRGLYREIKGLTSSELEQVMLKATKPDDSPVKGKHVERLVGVTYQISARYDIYDAVLRKLWKKMVETDWRTKLKALYVLHRFSADGAPGHGPALKARLRELRRSKDPKTKEKYFNSKQLLKGDNSPECANVRAFTARYAHYVLLRAQCFAGMFTEIAPQEETPASSKASKKTQSKLSTTTDSITSTALRNEHLEAARLLLKAGSACTLKDGEESENTACCLERVAVDMMGLTAAVATELNRAIKGLPDPSADLEQIKLWCLFYSQELLPQTKALVKKTSPKLDAYGLFLPTRLGASVSQELLKIGLEGATQKTQENSQEEDEVGETPVEEEDAKPDKSPADETVEPEKIATMEAATENEDEGEYEYEEYYDDDGDEL